MERRAFLAACVAGTISGCSGRLTGPDLSAEDVAIHFRDHVNEARSDDGVGYFLTDETLVEIASYHAENMVEESYLGLTSPSGETFADRYQKFDYSCGGVPMNSEGPRVGNAILFRIRFDEGSRTEREIAEKFFELLLQNPEKKELAFWDFWSATGTGAAVGTEAAGRTVVYLAQYYC